MGPREIGVEGGGGGGVEESRLINTTAPLTGGGDLSADLTLGINQATVGTDGYLTKEDFATFSDKMDNPMSALGDLIYGGAAGAPTRLPVGGANEVLHGGSTPSYSGVTESDLLLSNVNTANADETKHGLLPILSGNANQWLDGAGNWSTPSGGITASYTSVSFSGQTSVNVVHNFGAYPAVQIIDNTGAVLIPLTIIHTSINDFTVTFQTATSGTIIATIGSPQRQSVVSVSTAYLITTADRIIKAIVAGIDITLLSAVGIDGAEFVIDNAATGDIRLLPDGAETIQGESYQTIPPDSAIHVYSDGVGWRIY